MHLVFSAANRRQIIRMLPVISVVFLGAALRIWDIGWCSIWYDEGSTLMLAENAFFPWRLLMRRYGCDPPLTPFLTGLWEYAGGWMLEPCSSLHDVYVRLIPFLFSVLSIPMLYILANQLTDCRRTAICAAFLLAISPFHVFYAQELRPYAAMFFLASAALWMLALAVETNWKRYWAGYALLLVLSQYNHYFSLWTILVYNLAFFIMAKDRRLLIPWLASQVMAAVLITLVLPAMLSAVNATGSAANWYPPLRWMDGLLTIKAFFAGYGPRAMVYVPLALLASVMMVLGSWRLRPNIRVTLMLLMLAVLPIAANLALWKSRDFTYYEHRLFMVSALSCLILAGSGLAALGGRRSWIVGAVIVFLTIPALADYYAGRLHPDMSHLLGVRPKASSRPAAAFIRSNWRDGDLVAHACHLTLPPFRNHYMKGFPNKTVGFTQEDRDGVYNSFPHPAWEYLDILPHRLDSVTSDVWRVWMVDSSWNPDGSNGVFPVLHGWLKGHGVQETRRVFPGVTVTLYDLSPRPIPSTTFIKARSFSRLPEEGDAWRLINQRDERYRDPKHALVMMAFLRGSEGDGAVVHMDARFPEGEWDLWARLFTEAGSGPGGRARLRMSISGVEGSKASAHLVGEPDVYSGMEPGGWKWVLAGRINTGVEPSRIWISAHNDGLRPEAYADISMVGIVKPGEGPPAD